MCCIHVHTYIYIYIYMGIGALLSHLFGLGGLKRSATKGQFRSIIICTHTYRYMYLYNNVYIYIYIYICLS